MSSAKFLATSAHDNFTSPEKWDFSIYSFDPKSFWYSKTTLPVAGGCEIVRYDFRGRVRFRAQLKKPAMQINFIDSYSTTSSRLQGMGKIDTVVMVTLGNYDWDGISDLGALGIEINLDEETTRWILSEPALFQLEMLSKVFGTRRSIVARPTPGSLRLKELALSILADFDRASGIKYDKVGCSENLSIDTSDFYNITQIQCEAVSEMAGNVINEIASGSASGEKISSPLRRSLAIKVEQILWEHPASRASDEDIGVEELAVFFGVSKRILQMAIQEQFGIGFTPLRRIIRLHQIRQALHLEKRRKLTELAANYYVSHLGRFSKEYRELFGSLPSADQKRR